MNDNLLECIDWVERFLDSKGLRRSIWATIASSALYFSVIIFDVFTR